MAHLAEVLNIIVVFIAQELFILSQHNQEKSIVCIIKQGLSEGLVGSDSRGTRGRGGEPEGRTKTVYICIVHLHVDR